MERLPLVFHLRDPAFQRLWLGLNILHLWDQFTIIALLWFVL
jgi:hypothetical protein